MVYKSVLRDCVSEPCVLREHSVKSANMSGPARVQETAVNYGGIGETDLEGNMVDILVTAKDGLPKPIRALKSGITNITYSEISETYVRSLGFSTTTADGKRTEFITLTWRPASSLVSMDEKFRIVLGAKCNVVLGKEACDEYVEVGRRCSPLVIDSGEKGDYQPPQDTPPIVDRLTASRKDETTRAESSTASSGRRTQERIAGKASTSGTTAKPYCFICVKPHLQGKIRGACFLTEYCGTVQHSSRLHP